MSSYYFDNSDQGPPGNGWVNEHRYFSIESFIQHYINENCRTLYMINAHNKWHFKLYRWSSIMNMVQFANKVVGTGVENWQAGYNYLGFSR